MDYTRLLFSLHIILGVGYALLCSSCGQSSSAREEPRVEEEIKEYYDRFQEYYGINPYYVSATFEEELVGDDGNEDVVGICKRWKSGKAEIVLERPYWNGLSDYGREELVFHELGHCVLGRGHNNENVDGCPVSIMNEYTFGETKCYSDNRNELIQELGEQDGKTSTWAAEKYRLCDFNDIVWVDPS